MSTRSILMISVIVVFAAIAVAAVIVYRYSGISKEIQAFADISDDIDDIGYGRIVYDPITDVVTVYNVKAVLRADLGVLKVGKMTLHDTSFGARHDARLHDVTFNNTDSTLTIKSMKIDRFSPVSFVNFLTASKDKTDYISEWFISSFDMHGCEISELQYSGKNMNVSMDHFILAGPLTDGQSPENLYINASNIVFHIADAVLNINKLEYQRSYEAVKGLYKVNLNASSDLFSLTSGCELSDFNAGAIVYALRYDNVSAVLDSVRIGRCGFDYTDSSFIKFMERTGFDLNAQLNNKLPEILKGIKEKDNVTDALFIFYDNSRFLTLSSFPEIPVPYGALDNATQFNSLGLKLKVNDMPPVEIHK